MKSPKQLFKEFNDMPLGKQSLIACGTIAGIIAILTNYKSIKQGSKSIVSKFTQDENVQEFMSDVDKTTHSFVNLVNKFFKNEDINNKKEEEE